MFSAENTNEVRTTPKEKTSIAARSSDIFSRTGRKFARCSLCYIRSAWMLQGTQNTARVPFVAVTGGVLCVILLLLCWSSPQR